MPKVWAPIWYFQTYIYLSAQEQPGSTGPQHSPGSPQQGRSVLCRHLQLSRLGMGGEGGGGVHDRFWKKLRGKNSKCLSDGQRNTLRGGWQMLINIFWWIQRDDGHKSGNWKRSSKWEFSCELVVLPLNWVKQGHFYAETHGDASIWLQIRLAVEGFLKFALANCKGLKLCCTVFLL